MAVNLAQESISVWSAAQNWSSLRSVFEKVTAHTCPKEYNFHIHTHHSDGKLSPEEVVEQAISIGLKGFAITDHHSVEGYRIAQRLLEAQSCDQAIATPLPQLWTGTEINAGLLGIEVHILAYAFDPEHPSMKVYLQGDAIMGRHYGAQAVIRAIHEANGLAVLAHPSRYRLPATELIPEVVRYGIDAVETYYAYGNPFPWQPSPKQTKQVKQLARVYRILNTCGTDSHGMSLLRRL
jgi:predicted metal-dependent phosphoesterase TrpH